MQVRKTGRPGKWKTCRYFSVRYLKISIIGAIIPARHPAGVTCRFAGFQYMELDHLFSGGALGFEVRALPVDQKAAAHRSDPEMITSPLLKG